MWYTYTHTHTHTHTHTLTHTMDYYLVMKENEILPFVTMWIKLEDIMSFSDLLTLLNILHSSSIHIVTNGKISFFLITK